MKLKNLAKAGVKALGGVACGLGAAGAFIMAGNTGTNSTKAILVSTGVGMGSSAVVMLGQAATDVVDAFKRDE